MIETDRHLNKLFYHELETIRKPRDSQPSYLLTVVAWLHQGICWRLPVSSSPWRRQVSLMLVKTITDDELTCRIVILARSAMNIYIYIIVGLTRILLYIYNIMIYSFIH